ncbi:hypothetical protein Aab01nite_20110 [Paractinoplanes abujensis]|uniref:Uncharacterized protein n=1 Tax=Paractinoplanes abujensis TaxID=882441 RepID=A0A7W7G666_9ACTN|nr:DUF6297 family protein [Actinoplanes abujensis]MBB4697105.1 hypothetical protein [Actinoplanes abujensis]GID18421.1 hypothetical protein Aab01nite_20110 [Actinoplanes abujensis]
MTAVPLSPVRRWISRTQSSHRERGATLNSLYIGALSVAIIGGMLHRQIAAIFWPSAPDTSALAAGSLVAVCYGLLYLALRRFGPLALSRAAASWLLTAPVSRRRLLLPSLRLTGIAAAVLGGLAALAVVGHAAPRAEAGDEVALLAADGALIGLVLLLVATAAQAGGRWGDALDRLAGLLVAAGLTGLVAATMLDRPAVVTQWPPVSVLLPITGAVALVVLGALGLVVRGLAATPSDRILDASRVAGTLFDSAFGIEPSFLTDMIERRYWARRRLRSTRLFPRLPVLVAQDLLLTLRRRNRLVWLLLAALLPVLLGGAPGWVLGAAVLLGLLISGLTATGNVKTDAGNPVLLRMLGLSSRQAVLQRLWVPGVLAGLWAALALTALDLLGDLTSGPWWALGLTLGPVGAAAAVHRARVGFVRNELLPLDTPMGTLSTGPLVNAVMGPDMLLLGIPAWIAIGTGTLTPTLLLLQAVIGVGGARIYLSGTTADDRTELSN